MHIFTALIAQGIYNYGVLHQRTIKKHSSKAITVAAYVLVLDKNSIFGNASHGVILID